MPDAFYRRWVVAFLVFLLLAGCQQEKPPLRVALLEWPPYELAFWAEQNGWMGEKHIQLLEYKTPAEVTRAYASGAVDVIAVTSDFALTLAEQFPDTRIFLVIDASNGGDAVLSRTPVANNQQLVGKTIAVESGPLGSYMLNRFMDRHQLEPGDLTINYVDIPGQLIAWQQQKMDLLITYEPSRSKLIEEGAVEIFTSRDIPNEIIDVFLIRERVMVVQKKSLSIFVNGWFKAVADLDQSDANLFHFIGEREGLPAGRVETIFKDIAVPGINRNREFLAGVNNGFNKGLEQHETIMLKDGLMQNKINKQSLLTLDVMDMVEDK